MSRHHANYSERDRSHDDQRHEIGFELRHHQQVNQQQAHAVCDAHVAESLEGHLPFTVPLQRITRIGVTGLLEEIALQFSALLQRHVAHFAVDAEHAIQRAIEFARHVAEHIHHRQQILVVDRVIALHGNYLHQLRKWHQYTFPGSAVAGSDLEFQHIIDAAAVCGGQADAQWRGIFRVGVVQRGDILSGQRDTDRIHDVAWRNAQQCCLALHYLQQHLGGGFGHAVVDADDVRCFAELFAYLARHFARAFIIRPVYFRDDRRHHRRTRRHLDDLHIRVPGSGDFLYRLQRGTGNLMAAAAAMMLVAQVHLYIALLGGAAQIVLTYQTVEIDRRSRPGVGLVIGDFRDSRQIAADLMQHCAGLLQWCADRHIHDNLKLRLVVERQHFQHHQFHHTQRYGQQQAAQYGQPQFAPRRFAMHAVQKRS